MKSKYVSAVVGLAITLLMTACAQPPTADIDAAKQALDGAKAAQAPEYAPDAWNAASDTQAKLDAELQTQQDRNAMFRSYDKAKALAADLKSQGDQAVQAATQGKEKAKSDAATLMTQARDEYERAQKALADAPHGKGTQADLASLKSDATSIEATLGDMQKAFDAGDFLAAKSKAQAAISSAQQIQKEIETARAQRHSA